MTHDYCSVFRPRMILAAVLSGVILHVTSGCAAWPVVSGLTSGGVTLYKSARESGPKVELVIFKAEINHTVYQAPVK